MERYRKLEVMFAAGFQRQKSGEARASPLLRVGALRPLAPDGLASR